MPCYVVIGDIPYKIDIIIRVISKEEIPRSLFIFWVGDIPKVITIAGKAFGSFMLLFDVDGGFHILS